MENLDEFMQRLEEDEKEEQRLMSFRDYAKHRKMAPQLLYYHLRNTKGFWGYVESCECGRRCIVVKEADEFFDAREAKKPK